MGKTINFSTPPFDSSAQSLPVSTDVISTDTLVSNKGVRARVNKGTATAAGTPTDTITMGALTVAVKAHLAGGPGIDAGTSAATFATNVATYFETNKATASPLILSVTDNGDGTFTTAFVPGSAANSIVFSTTDPNLSFADIATGSDAETVQATVGDVVGYKSYVARITQNGGAVPPVATVLKNSLGGELVWSRSGMGTYMATLAGVFPNAVKVWSNMPQIAANGAGIQLELTWNDVNSLVLTGIGALGGGDPVDGFTDLRLEIRVYP